MIWNPAATDYSAGVEIYDPITTKVFTEEEARAQPKSLKERLCIRAKKVGCWVYTIEELDELMRRRKNEKHD